MKHLEAVRADREKRVNQLIIATTNLRHINEVNLTANVVCSPGAKYGHLSNQLAAEDLTKYETVTIVGGCNNYKPTSHTEPHHNGTNNPWVYSLRLK